MAEDEVANESVAGTQDSAPWVPSVLTQPLSRLQAIIGITAGLISVVGVVGPLVGFGMTATHGEFVAVVHEARSRQPILDATVEITTGQDAVVTTLVSMDAGRVHQSLKEGQYRVRVIHPKYTPEVRQVQVIGGRTSEVHLVLAPRPVPPPPVKPVEKPAKTWRFFSDPHPQS
jgi:hypothetical protein